MELRDRLLGRRVYFDANIIIYLIEGFPLYQKLINDVQLILENDDFVAYTSELSICESLIKPFKVKADNTASLFRTFLEESGCFSMIAIDRDILIKSAHIAASTAMKTPDAIHIATAMASGCDLFLSNDKNIRMPESLEKILPADYLDG